MQNAQVSTLHQADVDLGGLLAVLADNLYSTPVVALRELVQNAHDSCTRRQLEDTLERPRIVVEADRDARTLTITDNGAGLTRDEVQQYLATLGAGYTRLLREEHGSEDLIGAFGLGFLSAYVIAERVVVTTTSYQAPEDGWRFVSRDGQRYSLEPCAARPIGTEVTLHLRKSYAELSQPARVHHELRRYGALLKHPVFAPDVAVNDAPPPWAEDEANPWTLKRLRMAFAERFEPAMKPLCTLPLEGLPDGARGLAWVQDGARYASSDSRKVTLFVRGMLITDDARELLPEWAGFCGAVIVSDRVVPTASREDVKRDDAYTRLQSAIAESLVKGLQHLATHDTESWARVLRRHNEGLLAASLVDVQLFLLLRDRLRVPTSEGPLPMTEVQRRSEARVLVSTGDSMGYQEVLYNALGRPVVDGARFAALPFAQRWCESRGVPMAQVGTDDGDSALFRPTSVSEGSRALLQERLGDGKTQVVPARFSPASLPAVRVPDREVALKRRLEAEETDGRIASGVLALARSYTQDIEDTVEARLYVNLDNPVVQRLLVAHDDRAEHAAHLIRAIAELTCRERVEGLETDTLGALEALTSALEALL